MNISQDELATMLQIHNDKISMLADIMIDLVKRVEQLENK